MQQQGCGHIPSQMVSEVEALWGVQFEPGFNTDATFYDHLWQPLLSCWRPLLFYLLLEGIGRGAWHLLRRWGFQKHHHK